MNPDIGPGCVQRSDVSSDPLPNAVCPFAAVVHPGPCGKNVQFCRQDFMMQAPNTDSPHC